MPEDVIELKLEDLVGETNMSNIGRPCKRPGDLVTLVPCTDHDVDFKSKKGFFIMDMYTIGKKSETELADFIRGLSATTGCIGEDDCSVSLEDAIEMADKPDVFLCPEEDGELHTTRSDRSCKSHPDNSCMVNIIRTLLMTYRAMKKATKRGIRDGEVPTIVMKDLFMEKPVIPVTINTAISFSTLERGGEYGEKELDCLPHYAGIVFDKLLKKIRGGADTVNK